MTIPSVWSSAARRFSLLCPAPAPFGCRLRDPGIVARHMSSKRKMDHLERTANNYRQCALYPAQVCGIINESETVKRLRIAAHPDFRFKAGQWVDFFIPGVEKVGGFSMCSSPGLLQREGIIELAVKYSKHPPAHWVHTLCAVGSQVAMRVGGDFFFDPSPSDPAVDVLLVAGGVGINPLYSILLHTTDLMHLNRSSGGRDYNIGSVHLSYSAKNTQELLFKGSIVEACREFPDKFSCDFHVTQQSTDVDPSLTPFLSRGRITEEGLRARVDPQKTLCFLCGPPPMIEQLSKTLLDSGLPKDKILFEKWW
ncbi:oxidoreductase NAD-binding domain-containing protein 1 [Takifugu rubripes]|uniref:Oxidoreductase NAD-binding domain-containing protein 1 n=1 Tax=Takifugu rubripes TaxID=31033 RepID=H2UTQ2_TAKRU|nr:oxidoreductase NAD-binding domain-containing protein 1 [Takifugu rubripes]|eukprot:XP_003969023.2 PREDICTED: oxidoreductase NAD-binding domain-containing protein 1 isoform X2 [Takifugu rubripes]